MSMCLQLLQQHAGGSCGLGHCSTQTLRSAPCCSTLRIPGTPARLVVRIFQRIILVLACIGAPAAGRALRRACRLVLERSRGLQRRLRVLPATRPARQAQPMA